MEDYALAKMEEYANVYISLNRGCLEHLKSGMQEAHSSSSHSKTSNGRVRIRIGRGWKTSLGARRKLGANPTSLLEEI